MAASDPGLRVEEDARLMAAALALGRRELGRTWPNPAVGALVVAPGNGNGAIVLGRGWTAPGGRPHAETVALDEAGAAARGATLYVTLEPCAHFGRAPPCVDAVLAAGIARVVSAIEDPDPRVRGQGYARLHAAGVATTLGIGAAEAMRANIGHITRITKGRPHVQLKLALSADERIARVAGKPTRITGDIARDRTHMIRAEADAVAIGVDTVIADDPLLTCRLPGMADRSPVRIVFDTFLRTPLDSALVKGAREVPLWIVTAEDRTPGAEAQLVAAGVEVIRVRRYGDRPDLDVALKAIAARGITRLLVEGGATLAAALIGADLVDEALLFRAPSPLGAGALAIVPEPLAERLARNGLRHVESWPLGPDRLDIYWRG
ncbi:MAG TPA: bifunctional diaminohydroxyphosphoribosylaminopyrimidine deaminase/5-amino-6-(5-phosphoribosylamino)uracil reductase RibD [Hyphomicrobiales bacterium]|nr:bifunctional diaminohydroxyphosphoribosylaminopyrimidine deaminase/5-amino-6-(5-phosphoribosylamino)uracil reductase RibD [Hyphomicrobiales bacterium]